MRWVRALAAWWIESAGVPTGFDPAATLRAAGRGYARETIAASAGILGAYSAHHLIGGLPLAAVIGLMLVLSGVAILLFIRAVVALEGYWSAARRWSLVLGAHGVRRSAPGRLIALLPLLSWLLVPWSLDLDGAAGVLAESIVIGVPLLATAVAVARALSVSTVSTAPWQVPPSAAAGSAAAVDSDTLPPRP